MDGLALTRQKREGREFQGARAESVHALRSEGTCWSQAEERPG